MGLTVRGLDSWPAACHPTCMTEVSPNHTNCACNSESDKVALMQTDCFTNYALTNPIWTSITN